MIKDAMTEAAALRYTVPHSLINDRESRSVSGSSDGRHAIPESTAVTAALIDVSGALSPSSMLRSSAVCV